MAKEFFKAHFFPDQFSRREWFTNSLNYWLAALVFNAFPLPQREAGARQTLRYIGEILEDGFSVLIFPEGRRSEDSTIDRFRPGTAVALSCDGCATGLVGKVQFVASRPEYTPPVIYSLEARDKLVFMVEALPSQPRQLVPGQPMDVQLRDAAGQ